MPYDQVMHKWKAGSLRSSSGQPVRSQKQAVAIMLSEKRKADEGDEEYKPKGLAKVGSLKGFGKPKTYHPLRDAKTANY